MSKRPTQRTDQRYVRVRCSFSYPTVPLTKKITKKCIPSTTPYRDMQQKPKAKNGGVCFCTSKICVVSYIEFDCYWTESLVSYSYPRRYYRKLGLLYTKIITSSVSLLRVQSNSSYLKKKKSYFNFSILGRWVLMWNCEILVYKIKIRLRESRSSARWMDTV